MCTYCNATGSGYISEQRYASAKCRIDIAKSHFHVAKKHLKKGDDIAALAYMQCSMNQASRAMLELKEECDEKHIDVMFAFEKMYRQANLFSRDDFLFLHELFCVFDKIVRGDFFAWPRESFSEMLKKIEIFIRNAEKILSVYYICTDKVIENSIGGKDHE